MVLYTVCDNTTWNTDMEIICPVNNKGGVGKTTITKTLCEYFSIVQKKSVLVIDLDHQCNLSNRFISMEIHPNEREGKLPPIHPEYDPNDLLFPEWTGRSSIADVYFGKPVLPYQTFIENLDILPANTGSLLAVEHVRKDEVAEKVHNQLAAFLNLEEVKETYDVVVIDTPPSKGPLTTSAIRAATQIIIPSVMEPQPIEGIYGMLQLWKQEQLRRSSESPIHLIGILPNMFNSQISLHNGLLQGLKDNPMIADFVIPHKLGRRVAFAEVDAEGAQPSSIFQLPNSNSAKTEALLFCDYINERIKKNG